MDQLACQCLCDNNDHARYHSPPRQQSSKRIHQLSKTSKFIIRVLDCSATIVQVLIMCGIHEIKAKTAYGVIIFAFVHYKTVQDPVNDLWKKKLRKNVLLSELSRKCRMNRVEAELALSIIQKAFNAFYSKQWADDYNPEYVDEEEWMRTATETAELFAFSEGLQENEKKKLENRIKIAYGNFIWRTEEGREQDEKVHCTCCVCKDCKFFEDKRFQLFANVLPKEDEAAYQYKHKLIEMGRKALEDPDPCGIKCLEWQDKLRAAVKCPCGYCVSVFCDCEHHAMMEFIRREERVEKDLEDADICAKCLESDEEEVVASVKCPCGFCMTAGDCYCQHSREKIGLIEEDKNALRDRDACGIEKKCSESPDKVTTSGCACGCTGPVCNCEDKAIMENTGKS